MGKRLIKSYPQLRSYSQLMVARVGRVNLLQEYSIDRLATHGSVACPPAKYILVTLVRLGGFSKV